MSTISGSCLCGKVSFESEDDFKKFHFCHCIQCQKVTGSAHASNLFTVPSNIKWLSGLDSVKRFDVPGRAISNAFCNNCGSNVPYISRTGKALVVPAGSLNGTANIEPDSHIFCSEKASWYDNAMNAKAFNKFPK